MLIYLSQIFWFYSEADLRTGNVDKWPSLGIIFLMAIKFLESFFFLVFQLLYSILMKL